ncbi:hypothetical protein AsAng_0027450 [Aureispira anguillae]|uniref:Uncharacterized protein n=1 Tax=Aureispira anguillae TaxID=2864201 RepID=A0A915YFE3_9BACT|nr:hypothetical protein AsAng_0027450 [Aureispira anguillae]
MSFFTLLCQKSYSTDYQNNTFPIKKIQPLKISVLVICFWC